MKQIIVFFGWVFALIFFVLWLIPLKAESEYKQAQKELNTLIAHYESLLYERESDCNLWHELALRNAISLTDCKNDLRIAKIKLGEK